MDEPIVLTWGLVTRMSWIWRHVGNLQIAFKLKIWVFKLNSSPSLLRFIYRTVIQVRILYTYTSCYNSPCLSTDWCPVIFTLSTKLNFCFLENNFIKFKTWCISGKKISSQNKISFIWMNDTLYWFLNI